MNQPRIVCHFSCGAASAVATKLAIAQYGHSRVTIVNAFVAEEHPDNRRFAADCELWFGHPITALRNEKYNASTFEVFRRKRFIKGPHGAPCSLELKRNTLNKWASPEDIYVLGYTAEELDRWEDWQDNNPGRAAQAPLIENHITHDDCLALIDRAGIKLPVMYAMGYENANCRGCPKGGINYWRNIREDFPEHFHQMKAIQEEIGPGAYFLRWRSGPRNGERMPLSDLPPGRGDMRGEPSFSCSFFCQLAEQDISGKP